MREYYSSHQKPFYVGTLNKNVDITCSILVRIKTDGRIGAGKQVMHSQTF